MKHMKKVLSLILVVCMFLSIAPLNLVAANKTETTTTITKERSIPLDTKSFYKIFHLDAGRKYFSLEQIKEIIDIMSKNDYNTLELAVGNDGLRFLLDDMSVTANGETYSSAEVKAEIQKGNKSYYDAGEKNELTQSEMDTILEYAQEKDISVIPLINMPGHMDAILSAMYGVGISDSAYSDSSGKTSKTTIDVTNEKAVNFTLALAKKYIQYFANKGCTIYNMGADEYANDVSTSNFAQMNDVEYAAYIEYINNMAAQIQNAGMTAMAFNDGIYYKGDTSHGTIDTDIAVAYWSNTGTSAADLVNKGFKIINTNNLWYYVLGADGTGWAGYDRALSNAKSTKVTTIIDNSSITPAGSMLCVWCDTPSVAYSDTEVARISNLMSTQASSNPAYFSINNEEAGDNSTERVITITVGGTYTVEVGSTDVSVNKELLDENTATVGSVQMTGESGNFQTDSIISGKQYLLVNQESLLTATQITNASGVQGLTCVPFDASANNSAQLWTISSVNGGYTIQNVDGKYLNIASSNGNADITLTDTAQVLTVQDLGTTFTFANGNTYLDRFNSTFAGGWGGSGAGSSNENEQWTLYQHKTEYEIAITGKAIGETQVVIDNVTYIIKVVEEDLTQVAPLTITRYLSTYKVYDVDDHNNGNIVSVSAEQSNLEDGIALVDVVPDRGWWKWAGTDIETVFWKGVILDNVDQSSDVGTDYSMRGVDFSYIRYWEGNWQYSKDRNTWITIKDTDYVNAYYLQKTAVTSEVDTYVKDWAFTTQNSADKEDGRYQKALSFGVVYPNGNLSPATEDDIYKNATLIYWDNLANLGFIRVGTNEVYEVEKITYTLGQRNQSAPANWNENDSIIWEKVAVAGTDDKWYDETICWDESYGTEPIVDGVALENQINAGNSVGYSTTGSATNFGGTWGANDAVLILIYLKPIRSEDSLIVRYWDDSTNSEIYNYPLNISNTSTEEKGTFLNRLVQESEVQVGEITLDDMAYVINAKGVNEYFEKDLTKISELRGKYTSGLYDYMSADISSDGKTLTLHYNLNSDKLEPYYIADFGLPVEIPFTDLGTGVVSVTATVPNTANGTVEVKDPKVIFKATKAYTGVTVLAVTATYEGGDTQMFNVGIYPATTVYYEENFATGDFALSGSEKNHNQQALAYGNNSDHSTAYNFGYDEVYSDDVVGASNGTQAESSTIGDDAVFTFTGTGVDIYANCATDTGSVNIMIRDSSNSLVKLLKVNTATGKGTTATTGEQNVTSYSLPIASLNGLERDTYTVTIRHCKTEAGEEESGKVYLDGFKVFGTIDESAAVYSEDKEQNPNYAEVRNSVLKALNVTADTSTVYAGELAGQVYDQLDGNTGAIIISTSENNAQDLLDNGPKNEIFLRKGESLVFNLGDGITSAQIGLKAVNASVTYAINGSVKNMNTSTDMFYKLDKIDGEGITIANQSDGILSVTDLKWFGDLTSFTAIEAPTPLTLRRALVSLGYEDEEEPVEPEEPEVPAEADAILNISVADYSGKELASSILTATGFEGEEHAFTAAEVIEAAQSVLPKGYALADESSVANQTVIYGEDGSVNVLAGKVATLQVTYKKKNKVAGTATLTHVQTTSSSKYTFTAQEIKDAAPSGCRVNSSNRKSVKYGSTAKINVSCK